MVQKRRKSRSKVGCALCCFCLTLICLNTTKTAQDPCAKVFVRFGFEKDNIDGQLIKQVGVNCSLNSTEGVLL